MPENEESSNVPARILDAMSAPLDLVNEPYQGAMQVPLTMEESQALAAPFPPEAVSIKPQAAAVLYIGHSQLRQRMNKVLGIGQWTLFPAWSEPRKRERMLTQFYRLYVRGAYAAECYAEAELIEHNDQMSWSDVMEALESNGIMRTLKKFGVGLQVWDPNHNAAFVADHCMKVFLKTRDGKVTVAWRRKDAQPFWNETGPVPVGANGAPAWTEPERKPPGPPPGPPPATKPPRDDLAEEAREMDRREAQAEQTRNGTPDLDPAKGWRRGVVVKVEAKNGTTKGIDWTRYGILFKTEKAESWTSTFDTDLGHQLEALVGVDRQIWIRCEKDSKGKPLLKEAWLQ